MNKKICFVIMGFGRKTDPSTGKTLDLDKTYQNIIKPAVEKSNLKCVRADEIKDSGLIDKSMYALLMHADLVIADVSTYNPNAIYELGVRHAVRPFSTIIMKEKDGKIPFDIDHNRIFSYSHLGEDIGVDESKRCIDNLYDLINKIVDKEQTDSPLYEYIQNITPPQLPEDTYNGIIADLAQNEDKLFAVVEEAKCCKQRGDFEEAFKFWNKASNLMPEEVFFIQQKALCKYKSKQPSEMIALTDALMIIDDIAKGNDPETLGIIGAINKRLYMLNNDNEAYLDRAIESYEKGFNIQEDFYTGENYAHCLNIKSNISVDNEEKIYNRKRAEKVRERILSNLENIVDSNDINSYPNKVWIYATLAKCYYANGSKKQEDKYEKLFKELANQWQIDTYEENKNQLKVLLNL